MIWRKSKLQWHTQPNVSERALPRRLLVIRPDRLGDVVISSSCLLPLREHLPDAYIAWAVRAPYTPLFRDNPLIDELIELPDVPRAFDKVLRRFAFDTAVLLNPDARLEEAVYRAGIPQRIGYTRGQGEHLTEWVHHDWKKAGYKHEALLNFDILERIGVTTPSDPQPYLTLKPSPHAPPAVAGRPYVLFHLASHGNKPRVPPDFFIALARRLLAAYDYCIVLVGASADDPSLRRFLTVFGQQHAEIINLAGKTRVEELAELCQHAQLMLTRDSGPAHLAAAIGCPTLTFFINSKRLMRPERWRPLGTKVEIYYKPVLTLPYEPPRNVARRIIRRFDADEVFALMEKMLHYGNSR